jgi:PAS domain S-box-containing protein
LFGIDFQTFYALQAFVAAAISMALILYLAPRWRTSSARALALLMGSVAVWALCYGMEFKSPGLNTKLQWARAEYLGAAWTGLLFFRFAMVITGKQSWLTGPKSWSLFTVPVLTIVGVYTNRHHHLLWSSAWIDSGGPIPTLAYHRSIGFWVHIGFSYTLLLIATVVLFQAFSGSGKLERRNFFLMMVGLAAPWLANVLYVLQIDLIRHLDLTPLALSVSGVTVFWAVIRHQMLDLIPIARDAVIESMQDAVFVLDLKMRVVDLNTAARQLIPEPAAATAGKTLATLMPELADRADRCREPGQPGTEFSATVDGVMHVFRMRQAELYRNSRIACGWLITLQDITAQRRNEIALRESEEKFRNISANALDGIVMIDPEGRVTFWNRAAEQIFGYQTHEIMGKDLHACLAPEAFHAQYRKGFSDFQLNGKGRLLDSVIEIQCLHKNGLVFPAELSLAALQLNGQRHAVGIVRDISERRKTQEFLIQTEKMLSLGGLAAGMAHEINNPLAGILSNIQVMRMRLLDDLPGNSATAKECGLNLMQIQAYMGKRGIPEMIEAVDQSCQRAAGIVRNMLDFSRKSDTVFSAHHLTALLDRAVALVNNDFKVKTNCDFQQIEIVRDYAQAMPAVACDGSQIQQVLLNILKNGAQAMWDQAGGNPSPRLRLSVWSDAAHAYITIADNGPGMPEEIRKRIFEPFYTTKPAGTGTGLGLSIAYFIVTEKHGGVLSVDSSPGRGTTFTVKLPLTQTRS